MLHKMFNHSRGGYKANIKQPPRRGQPPKRGQKCRSQSVLSSEVLLYHVICHYVKIIAHAYSILEERKRGKRKVRVAPGASMVSKEKNT